MRTVEVNSGTSASRNERVYALLLDYSSGLAKSKCMNSVERAAPELLHVE
jgi:hypothetical protein